MPAAARRGVTAVIFTAVGGSAFLATYAAADAEVSAASVAGRAGSRETEQQQVPRIHRIGRVDRIVEGDHSSAQASASVHSANRTFDVETRSSVPGNRAACFPAYLAWDILEVTVQESCRSSPGMSMARWE